MNNDTKKQLTCLKKHEADGFLQMSQTGSGKNKCTTITENIHLLQLCISKIAEGVVSQISAFATELIPNH